MTGIGSSSNRSAGNSPGAMMSGRRARSTAGDGDLPPLRHEPGLGDDLRRPVRVAAAARVEGRVPVLHVLVVLLKTKLRGHSIGERGGSGLDVIPAAGECFHGFLTGVPSIGWTTEAAAVPRYQLVIGSRRAVPKALGGILTPGGGWGRLYSLRSTMATTLLTTAGSKPRSTMRAGGRSCSTYSSRMGSRIS